MNKDLRTYIWHFWQYQQVMCVYFKAAKLKFMQKFAHGERIIVPQFYVFIILAECIKTLY